MQLSAFDQLQVSQTAEDDEIKSAYLAMIQRYSPDQHPTRFQEIRQAYEQIATKENRLNYLLLQSPLLGFQDFLSALMEKNSSTDISNNAMPAAALLQSLIQENLHAK